MSTPTIFLDKKFVYFNELQLHRYLENFILNRTSQKRKTSQVCMYVPVNSRCLLHVSQFLVE